MNRSNARVPVALFALLVIGALAFPEPLVAETCAGPSGDACPAGEFCELPDGVCDPLAEGSCTPYPSTCPDTNAPVCGCDGLRYLNACQAAAAGVSLGEQESCYVQACGGFPGWVCDEPQEQCFLDRCGFDVFGRCLVPPVVESDDCNPACACWTGPQYDNMTAAMLAGISFELGVCPDPLVVEQVRFEDSDGLLWTDLPDALAYNVYRKVSSQPAPTDAGECLQSEVLHPYTAIAGEPDVGQVWLLQISAVFSAGEGPLGLSGYCAPREPAAPCVP